MDDVFQFLSSLEKKVYLWLSRRKISFSAEQLLLGEYREAGSAIVDFYIDDRNLVIRCMGSYWHSTIEAKARDEMTKIDLQNDGYTVVDCWEENLEDSKINRTLEMALEGQEALR